MVKRRCQGSTEEGQLCRVAPLRHHDYCLLHSPEHQAEAAEARCPGGLRRRREATLCGAYDIGSLDTIADVRRLIQIAVLDTLSLDNSISRSRMLAYLAMTALKALEVGELEERLAALEAAVLDSRALPEPSLGSPWRGRTRLGTSAAACLTT